MDTKNAHFNQKVAKNRGPEWRKKLLSGRLEVQRHPTLLRVRRVFRKWTQAEIATKVSMTTTSYSAVESGRRPVSRERAASIAKILGIAFDKAFGTAIIEKGRYQARKA